MTLQPAPPAPEQSAPTGQSPTGQDALPLADRAVVAHLLSLAGPSGAAALLAQIRTDLADLRESFAKGIAARDGAALRRASHVLVSLSGTIGASRTCAIARDLTGASPATGVDRLDRLARQLMDDIDRLIRDIGAFEDGATR